MAVDRDGTSSAPRIRGERPLVVFVSSVMNPEVEDLQWARDVAHDVVGNAPFLVPWMFEYTPASSEELDTGYLRKVREADFVLWLVGCETTTPVRREIQEALTARQSILVFKLPVVATSADTRALLDRVERHVKSTPVVTRESLGVEIMDAITDELIRAHRVRPRTGAVEAWIEGEVRRSRARCISSWAAAGVPFEKAAQLADDQTTAPALERAFTDDEPVRVITGPLGAGKSLHANRLIQSAAAACLSDGDSPVPVYLGGSALEAGLSLEENILARIPASLSSLEHGLVVVIDDATWLNPTRALALLAEAQALTAASPRSTVTFVARTAEELGAEWPQAAVQPLGERQALDLIGSLAGVHLTDIDILRRWPKNIATAVRQPLFAVLLGSYLRDVDGRFPKSPVDMVAELAVRAAERGQPASEGLQAALCRLARACLAWRAELVPEVEVGTIDVVRRLVATGLVRRERGHVGFSLQLFRDWYGCIALGAGDPAPPDVMGNMVTRDAWYEAFLLFLRTQSYDAVTRYLEEAVRVDPGYASLALSEAIDRWSESAVGLPPDDICETRMRTSMQAWWEGLPEIGPRIVPLDAKGELGVPRVRGATDGVVFGWYVGSLAGDDAPDLPPSIFTPLLSVRDWRHLAWTHVSPQSAWPWQLTQETLRGELSALLRAHTLLPEMSLGIHEAAWNYALRTQSLWELHGEPIALGSLSISPAVPDDAGLHGALDGLRVGTYRRLLQGFAEDGRSEFPPPWPTADYPLGARSGHIAAMYSAERLRQRIEASFIGALDLYERLVDEWFRPLASRLRVRSLMPLRVVGVLQHDPERASGSEVFWYMEPDDANGVNSVEINVGVTHDGERASRVLDNLYETCTRRRPRSGRLAGASTHLQGVSEFAHSYPIIDLAYDWLWTDLARLRWVDGMLRKLY